MSIRNDPVEQLDNVMRLSQVRLESLERPRLEALCQGLLEGHASILTVLAAETQATATIKELSTVNRDLMNALDRAHRLMTTDEHESLELIKAFVTASSVKEIITLRDDAAMWLHENGIDVAVIPMTLPTLKSHPKPAIAEAGVDPEDI